jgi:glycosyltransferase involved in cell wall biosynthesis
VCILTQSSASLACRCRDIARSAWACRVPASRTPGDDVAMAAAVGSLAANPELRQAFGAAGRAAVQGRSWAEVGDRLIEHYRSVLAERAAPTPSLLAAA